MIVPVAYGHGACVISSACCPHLWRHGVLMQGLSQLPLWVGCVEQLHMTGSAQVPPAAARAEEHAPLQAERMSLYIAVHLEGPGKVVWDAHQDSLAPSCRPSRRS